MGRNISKCMDIYNIKYLLITHIRVPENTDNKWKGNVTGKEFQIITPWGERD